jgi:hypothetical protein
MRNFIPKPEITNYSQTAKIKDQKVIPPSNVPYNFYLKAENS